MGQDHKFRHFQIDLCCLCTLRSLCYNPVFKIALRKRLALFGSVPLFSLMTGLLYMSICLLEKCLPVLYSLNRCPLVSSPLFKFPYNSKVGKSPTLQLWAGCAKATVIKGINAHKCLKLSWMKTNFLGWGNACWSLRMSGTPSWWISLSFKKDFSW